MKTLKFEGDPMVQLEEFEQIDNKIFLLNEKAKNEIIGYTVVPDEESIPEYLKEENLPEKVKDLEREILLAEAGISEETGEEFPDTYIMLANLKECSKTKEAKAMILKIFAEDIQYTVPENGEIVLLEQEEREISDTEER